jgi:glycyl-tRNA synthetase beta chain
LRRAALGILRIMDEADVALPLDKLMKHAADLYHFDDSDEDLPGFFRERLRVVLRNKGIAHDVVSAVLGCHDGIGHLHLIMRQSAQLDSFLKTDPESQSYRGGAVLPHYLLPKKKRLLCLRQYHHQHYSRLSRKPSSWRPSICCQK